MRAPDAPLPTYASYVGGRDIDAAEHIYAVSTRAILRDAPGALRLKRMLERGLIDPASAGPEVIGRCALAGPDTVRAALSAAAGAVREWSSSPLEVRLRLGELIRKRLAETRPAFVDIMVAEGRTRTLAEWEIDGLTHIFSPETLSWCAELLQRDFSYGGKSISMRRKADGVVCVAPPQNAPHSNCIYGAAALLSGNTVVVRAPRSIPFGVMYALREIIAPALEEVGAPPGTLNVVCGPPMMEDWLGSEHVDDIIYFGGVEKGMAFQRDCVAAGKKPILELAGNDCAVVWRDADLDLAAGALVEAFHASGQICNIPNQVIAHPAIADELIERLKAAAARIRPGYPEEEGVVLTPVLAADGYFAFLQDALRKGARLVCGGRRLEVDGTPSDTGFFIEPTVVRVDGLAGAREVEAVRGETFFPLLPVVVPEPGVSDERLLDEVLRFIDGNAYGLRNSLWTADERVAGRFVTEVRNGGVLKVNDDSHCGFYPYMPSHGGTGLTSGVFGEASYMMIRTTHLQGIAMTPPRVSRGSGDGTAPAGPAGSERGA
ncbi:putative aldehyde dehydrogenase [Sphaerisporangium melleum]|uniref:Aldehyde dehydrogenase n=1 Tax=Sphaerisporangium melleum TaxID=321316 RepID=A0A917VR81_9ACTN|nr:aldehyde dehydrogenase family protein [Sphaerisporangium melleum]GGL06150.1 putative aldehyde dehydrogenase [Sphaerisporangium melleum]GII73111.1 putative aldehyde dehydrogenase [Sphaerisporangium melleum]